jgi:hypothetical protein
MSRWAHHGLFGWLTGGHGPCNGWRMADPDDLTKLLVGMRDEAARDVGPDTPEKERDGAIRVWNAAEVALGMLDDGYLPRRAAVADVAERVARRWTI